MKKIVMGIAALTCAVSMFAVDFNATVKFNTTIAEKNGDAVDFFKVNPTDQKDSDALIISANTDKAGANFQFWYRFDGTNGENLYRDLTKKEAGTSAGSWEDANLNELHGVRIRGVNLWFKPIDQVKVTVGNINMESYKERIFWWHGVRGGAAWTGFGGDYIAGTGAKVEVTPMAGLSLEAGIFPGISQKEDGTWTADPFFSTDKDYGYKGYGVKAKYSMEKLSGTLIFADSGKDANKFLGLGADFGNWGTPYYGFANLGLYMGKDGDKIGVLGFALDDFISYKVDAFTVQAHIPFVMYKCMDSWDADHFEKWIPAMFVSVKASYAIGGFTPYLLITNEPDGAGSQWKFNDQFEFSMTFKPGVTFNVGSASFDAAFRADVSAPKDKDVVFNWSIPCGITVGL